MDLLIFNSYSDYAFEQIEGFSSRYQFKSPKELNKIEELSSSNDKILVIDPDFVGWKLDKSNLESIDNIKAIVITTTSESWVDKKYLDSRNIDFFNVSEFSSVAVSEFYLYQLLRFYRDISIPNSSADSLFGKRVGIIGFGDIGSNFARLVAPFASNICYWSRVEKNVPYEQKSIDEIIESSDVIFYSVSSNISSDVLFRVSKKKFKDKVFISPVSLGSKSDKKLTKFAATKALTYIHESGSENVEGYHITTDYRAWYTKKSLRMNDERVGVNLLDFLNERVW